MIPIQGSNTMTTIITFQQLLDQYILERSLTEASIGSYRRVLRCFTKDTGITKLSDISLPILLEWRLAVTVRASDIT